MAGTAKARAGSKKASGKDAIDTRTADHKKVMGVEIRARKVQPREGHGIEPEEDTGTRDEKKRYSTTSRHM